MLLQCCLNPILGAYGSNSNRILILRVRAGEYVVLGRVGGARGVETRGLAGGYVVMDSHGIH
jgi:hypothetical protein